MKRIIVRLSRIKVGIIIERKHQGLLRLHCNVGIPHSNLTDLIPMWGSNLTNHIPMFGTQSDQPHSPRLTVHHPNSRP